MRSADDDDHQGSTAAHFVHDDAPFARAMSDGGHGLCALGDVHSAEGEDAGITEQNSTVIRLVNKILIDAYRREASDIHLEPEGPKDPFRVRFRIDGECAVYHELPPGLAAPVVARVKIMADLDIAEHRKPQDGKIRFRVGASQLELRVATCAPAIASVTARFAERRHGAERGMLRSQKPSPPRTRMVSTLDSAQ